MRDPYETLGVNRTATDAEIKKAYRRLARKHHPDVNPGDASAASRFQEIAAAYEVLRDPTRRQRYDRTGELGDAPPPPPEQPFGGFGRPGPSGGRSGSFRWSGDFNDLFSEIFSGSSGFATNIEEDEDTAAPLTISFRDAVLGGTVTFRARLPRRCKTCGGTGRSGRNACPSCHGARVVVEDEKISVRIPAGVTTGSKIRVPGKGRSESGDLYLAITVEPHPYFQRNGDDILAEVPVTVSEAYLGAEIEVPTIHGSVRARIPPGTAGGQKFRLKGRGVENNRSGVAGDHYYRVEIAMPTKTTPEGHELAEKFRKLYSRDVRGNLPKGA